MKVFLSIFFSIIALLFAHGCARTGVDVPLTNNEIITIHFPKGGKMAEEALKDSEVKKTFTAWLGKLKSRAAVSDYISYMPQRVVSAKCFTINFTGRKVILNVKSEFNWKQYSYEWIDGDEEIVKMLFGGEL